MEREFVFDHRCERRMFVGGGIHRQDQPHYNASRMGLFGQPSVHPQEHGWPQPLGDWEYDLPLAKSPLGIQHKRDGTKDHTCGHHPAPLREHVGGTNLNASSLSASDAFFDPECPQISTMTDGS